MAKKGNKTIKRIIAGAGVSVLLLTLVLCIHIYLVTRPKPLTGNEVAMARIDIQQPIGQEDAEKITNWLYQQNGVDHVLCNPGTAIVVFTFKPSKTTASRIVANFKGELNYKAERYLPNEKDMQNGCPVMVNSISGKVYSAFRKI